MARNRTALVGRECVACGSCVKACPAEALSIYKGLYARVGEALCIGCGRCEIRCPAGVISMAERKEAHDVKNALV